MYNRYSKEEEKKLRSLLALEYDIFLHYCS